VSSSKASGMETLDMRSASQLATYIGSPGDIASDAVIYEVENGLSVSELIAAHAATHEISEAVIRWT